jgi:hypothetical protein
MVETLCYKPPGRGFDPDEITGFFQFTKYLLKAVTPKRPQYSAISRKKVHLESTTAPIYM